MKMIKMEPVCQIAPGGGVNGKSSSKSASRAENRSLKSTKFGFTLAEMMVVMLILSVVMAAFAPIMTRRNKADLSNTSPWDKVESGAPHIYYKNSFRDNGQGVVEIGAKLDATGLIARRILGSRLFIATTDIAPNHISFGRHANRNVEKLADLRVTNNSIFLSSPGAFRANENAYSIDDSSKQHSVALGHRNIAKEFGIAIGQAAHANENSVAIGSMALNESTKNDNIAIGTNAGYKLDGTRNVLIGRDTVGYPTTTGQARNDSIAIGYQALWGFKPAYITENLSLGSSNIAIGSYTLSRMYDGKQNVAIGDRALKEGGSASNNVAIGYLAMGDEDFAQQVPGKTFSSPINNSKNNVAIGSYTLYKSKNGDGNVAIGSKALYESQGNNNIGIGKEAIYSDDNGKNNIAMGTNAMQTINYTDGFKSRTEFSNNIAIGENTLSNVSINSRSHNIYGNIALGNNALQYVIVGRKASYASDETYRKIGLSANNIAIGTNALAENRLSSSYVGGAYDSLGSDNIAIGQNALYTNKEGSYNIAIGKDALKRSSTAGSSSGYIDYWASDNIAIGRLAMGGSSNVSGSNNIALGKEALKFNTTGSSNIAIGYEALKNNYTGKNNIAIGYSACNNVKGSNKICIGKNSGPSASTQDDNIANNNLQAVFIGEDPSTDNGWNPAHVYIGGKSKYNGAPGVIDVYNSHNNKVGFYTNTTPNVDQNMYKSNVTINGNLIVKGYIMSRLYGYHSTDWWGLYGNTTDDYMHSISGSQYNESTEINKIMRNLTYISGTSYNSLGHSVVGSTHQGDLNICGYPAVYTGTTCSDQFSSDRRLKNISGANDDGLEKIKQLKVYNFTFKKDPKKLPHTGIIAQDLQKIFPNAVTKGEDGYLRVRWDEMFFAMINSIKELAAKVTGLEERLTKLEKENQELKARLNALEAKIK